MSQWVRLWDDMPNDPKWRVIAKRSGRPVSEVLSVFIHMMMNAKEWEHRGGIENWSDEDVAAAIDAEPEHVQAIRESMQGKTLDGNHLTGWEKRQSKTADESAGRVAKWREKKRASDARNEPVTVCNDGNGRREESREDKKEDSVAKATAADAAPEPPPDPSPMDEDPKAILFSASLDWLSQATGKPADKLRPLIGKMLKGMGGDQHAAALLGIFRDTYRERKADPIGWIQQMIAHRSRAGPEQRSNGTRGWVELVMADIEADERHGGNSDSHINGGREEAIGTDVPGLPNVRGFG